MRACEQGTEEHRAPTEGGGTYREQRAAAAAAENRLAVTPNWQLTANKCSVTTSDSGGTDIPLGVICRAARDRDY
jgi:hypothetical protein